MYLRPCAGTGTSFPVGRLSNIPASLHGDGYRHPCTGMGTSIPARAPSDIPESLHRDRHWHPHTGMSLNNPAQGTVKGTSILARGLSNIPASLHGDGYQHPQANTTQLHPGPSLTISSPANLLTHNPKAIRPGGKLKQRELHPRAPGRLWLPGSRQQEKPWGLFHPVLSLLSWGDASGLCTERGRTSPHSDCLPPHTVFSSKPQLQESRNSPCAWKSISSS